MSGLSITKLERLINIAATNPTKINDLVSYVKKFSSRNRSVLLSYRESIPQLSKYDLLDRRFLREVLTHSLLVCYGIYKLDISYIKHLTDSHGRTDKLLEDMETSRDEQINLLYVVFHLTWTRRKQLESLTKELSEVNSKLIDNLTYQLEDINSQIARLRN